jgi:hypothetical protein
VHTAEHLRTRDPGLVSLEEMDADDTRAPCAGARLHFSLDEIQFSKTSSRKVKNIQTESLDITHITQLTEIRRWMTFDEACWSKC